MRRRVPRAAKYLYKPVYFSVHKRNRNVLGHTQYVCVTFCYIERFTLCNSFTNRFCYTIRFTFHDAICVSLSDAVSLSVRNAISLIVRFSIAIDIRNPFCIGVRYRIYDDDCYPIDVGVRCFLYVTACFSIGHVVTDSVDFVVGDSIGFIIYTPIDCVVYNSINLDDSYSIWIALRAFINVLGRDTVIVIGYYSVAVAVCHSIVVIFCDLVNVSIRCSTDFDSWDFIDGISASVILEFTISSFNNSNPVLLRAGDTQLISFRGDVDFDVSFSLLNDRCIDSPCAEFVSIFKHDDKRGCFFLTPSHGDSAANKYFAILDDNTNAVY